MGTKFHIGDVVKAVKGGYIAYPNKGDLGIITRIQGGEYGIEWNLGDHTGLAAWFKDDELELVRKFEWPEA